MGSRAVTNPRHSGAFSRAHYSVLTGILLSIGTWVTLRPADARAAAEGEWVGPRFSFALVLGVGIRYVHSSEHPVRFAAHGAFAAFPLGVVISGDSFQEVERFGGGTLETTLLQGEVHGAWETNFDGSQWVRLSLAGGVSRLRLWHTSCENRTADMGSALLRFGITADSLSSWRTSSKDVSAAYSRGTAFRWPDRFQSGFTWVPYGEYSAGASFAADGIAPIGEVRTIASLAPGFGFACNE